MNDGAEATNWNDWQRPAAVQTQMPFGAATETATPPVKRRGRMSNAERERQGLPPYGAAKSPFKLVTRTAAPAPAPAPAPALTPAAAATGGIREAAEAEISRIFEGAQQRVAAVLAEVDRVQTQNSAHQAETLRALEELTNRVRGAAPGPGPVAAVRPAAPRGPGRPKADNAGAFRPGSLREVIYGFVRARHNGVGVAEIRSGVAGHGSESSIAPTLTKLVAEGHLVRAGNGVYTAL